MDHHAFAARQKHLTLDGIAHVPVDIAYTDLGPSDPQGPPLIVMHGIPTWSFLWRHVLDRLAERHRVIAPDFIGHGMSDRRDGLDRSLLAQRAMVLALMDRLGIARATLIGHDTGGGVAQIMALENPDRVAGLVLSNAVAYAYWPIDDMIALGHPGWAAKSVEEVRDFIVGGLADGLSRPERVTGEFQDGIVAPHADEEGKISLIRNAASLNTIHTTMLTGRLQTIVAPTLLVWGADDPWQPLSDGERLARDIPGARLVPVANASHWIPQDAPEEWLAAVEPFLSLGV